MCITALESNCRESKCRGMFDLLQVSFTEQQQLHEPALTAQAAISDSLTANSKRGLHTHKPVNLQTLACFGNMTSAGEGTWWQMGSTKSHGTLPA